MFHYYSWLTSMNPSIVWVWKYHMLHLILMLRLKICVCLVWFCCISCSQWYFVQSLTKRKINIFLWFWIHFIIIYDVICSYNLLQSNICLICILLFDCLYEPMIIVSKLHYNNYKNDLNNKNTHIIHTFPYWFDCILYWDAFHIDCCI